MSSHNGMVAAGMAQSRCAPRLDFRRVCRGEEAIGPVSRGRGGVSRAAVKRNQFSETLPTIPRQRVINAVHPV